jgi:diguanylate cyclase (GGDEF)-like protein
MRHESELQNKIEMDPVLKIYNRNAAVDRINKYLAANPDRRDYALLVMDIDDFKDINDTYGHLYGDAVIAMAAKELKDVTGNDGIVGRYGGDEFFVFIRGVSGSIIAEKAEQCVQHIKSIQVTDGKYITCSIGVALGMSFKETPNYKALFEKADKALYAVKNNGKADWKVYNEGKMADTDGHAIDYESEDDVDSAELVSSRDMMKVFLELSASAKTSDAAIYKIIRYVAEKFGVDWMQIMQVNSKEDLITIKYEWCNDPKFRNNAGRSGYYAHSDIIRFRDYFEKHPVFIVRPENTVGFSMKFQREFEKNMRYEVLYNANVTSDENFYMFVCTRFDKSKRWDETEALELNAATKMMTMYAAQAGKETENERKYKELVDYDKKTGLYTLQKFYEQMGRLRKIAAERGDSVAIIHTDIGNFLKFNRKFGTDEGDNVLKDFADIVVGNDNPDYNISAHVDGTDIFISARRVENGNLDFVNDIDRENKKFCAEQNKKYQGAELVFRTGVYVMNKEDLGGDAVDCAITAKRMAKNREESYCAVYANEQ